MLRAGLNQGSNDELPIDDLAASICEEHQQQKKRIPGLGHRIHSDDPRTTRLFNLAAELELSGSAVDLIRSLQTKLADNGKPLPINVDGAIAAVLVDMGIPSTLANSFFIMARLPGLVAHVYEEQSREKPMRRIHPTSHSYDGPKPRTLMKP